MTRLTIGGYYFAMRGHKHIWGGQRRNEETSSVAVLWSVLLTIYIYIYRRVFHRECVRWGLSNSVLSPCQYSWWREATDVRCHPPVWNLRVVVWFLFLSLSFFSLAPCSFCLIIFLLMVHPPEFQKIVQHFSLRTRLFCTALVEQLGDDSW